MPNYPTHARWGRIGAVVMAIFVGATLYWFFETPVVSVGAAVGAAGTTFVGSIFPDVDHHNSIPRRKANRALRAIVVLGVVSLTALAFEQLVDLADTASTEYLGGEPSVPNEIVVGVGAALVALLLVGAVDPLVGIATRQHRAWTHSVPATFALTATLAVGVWVLTRSLSVPRQAGTLVVVWTFFAGILIHLGLDGEIL